MAPVPAGGVSQERLLLLSDCVSRDARLDLLFSFILISQDASEEWVFPCKEAVCWGQRVGELLSMLYLSGFQELLLCHFVA